MHKKAASHVDWAISMGIFLLYVLSMFTLIQPGIQPLHKSSELVIIAEDGLKNDIYYNITKTPIYITVKPTKILFTNYRIIVPLPIPGDNTDFNITYKAISGSEVSARFTISGNDAVFNPPVAISGGAGPNGMTYNFFLYYSTDKYKTFPPSCGWGGCPVANGLFDYTMGATETRFGIDQAKLSSFTNSYCFNTIPSDSRSYQKLKERWKYPAEKDFSIYYVPSGKIPYNINTDKIDLCARAQPLDQSDIFVKEWIDWMLNTDSSLKPIILNVKSW